VGDTTLGGGSPSNECPRRQAIDRRGRVREDARSDDPTPELPALTRRVEELLAGLECYLAELYIVDA